MTATPTVAPRPSFFKRSRKAFSAAGFAFVSGVGASITALAMAQEINAPSAGNDIINTLGWGIGAGFVAFIGVYRVSNAADPAASNLPE